MNFILFIPLLFSDVTREEKNIFIIKKSLHVLPQHNYNAE